MTPGMYTEPEPPAHGSTTLAYHQAVLVVYRKSWQLQIYWGNETESECRLWYAPDIDLFSTSKWLSSSCSSVVSSSTMGISVIGTALMDMCWRSIALCLLIFLLSLTTFMKKEIHQSWLQSGKLVSDMCAAVQDHRNEQLDLSRHIISIAHSCCISLCSTSQGFLHMVLGLYFTILVKHGLEHYKTTWVWCQTASHA